MHIFKSLYLICRVSADRPNLQVTKEQLEGEMFCKNCKISGVSHYLKGPLFLMHRQAKYKRICAFTGFLMFNRQVVHKKYFHQKLLPNFLLKQDFAQALTFTFPENSETQTTAGA